MQQYNSYSSSKLFRNKRFMLDEMAQLNGLQNLLYFWNKKNPNILFYFFHFELKMKTGKEIFWVFLIPKIWQILKRVLLGHFIKHKPLFSEEWKQRMLYVYIFNDNFQSTTTTIDGSYHLLKTRSRNIVLLKSFKIFLIICRIFFCYFLDFQFP